MAKPPEERKEVEEKMKGEWDAWTAENASSLIETGGVGKTVRVDANGVTATKNDLMMYSMVQADSPEAAAQLFAGHPHLGIPEATIEIMPVKAM